MSREDTDPALSHALRRMATAVVPVEEPQAFQGRRARLLPDLAAVADREFSRRRKRRSAAAVAVAAAALAAGVALAVLRSPVKVASSDPEARASLLSGEGAVRVAGSGAAAQAVDRVPLALGDSDRVETLEGRAEVRLASGASVALGPRTRLDLLAATRTARATDEHVALPAGRILVHVPKLASGSHLMITTPNATVTVHGTAFVVDVHPGEGGATPETRVSVTEGLVSVASGGREVFLEPGASWSSGSAPPAAATAAPVAPAPSAATTETPPPSPKRSTLADENQLFKAALAARRSGHPEETIRLVGTLLSRYPDSPLSAEARAERDRARADLEHASAP